MDIAGAATPRRHTGAGPRRISHEATEATALAAKYQGISCRGTGR
jgi:hypothetical protein